ncbi:MAG: hypothetical protein HZA64_02875 [Rhodocyclales bacterium]|nr:hypothetical protein [Rhodocyclales bacterium]
MVTAMVEHDATDLDNELIMPFPIPRLVFLAMAFGLAAPVSAQQAGTPAAGDAGRKPLDLSLPREAVFPPGTITRQDPTLRDNLRAPSRQDDASDKATRDRARSEQDGATDAPYGTGFEARRRGLGGRGFGGGSGGGGGGGFGGGGRGMGRGR